MSETEEPLPATVVRFDALDQVGALELASGEVVRVGATACRGFVPKVGTRVWVVELAPHPLGGRRATRVHDTALTVAAFDAEAQRLKDLERTGQRVEARAWLSEHPTGYSADGMNVEAPDFVARLYEAGAAEVRVWAKSRGEQTWADLLEVALPTDDEARRAVFAIIDRERVRLGEEFAASPSGRSTHRITAEEAQRLGHPEAEGEEVESDGPYVDAGQTALTLWWD